MANELGDRVKLQSPVYRIDQTGDMVVVETVDKQTYRVSRVLLFTTNNMWRETIVSLSRATMFLNKAGTRPVDQEG